MAMPEKTTSAEQKAAPKYLWLVDDDEAMGVLVGDILEPHGHTVSHKGTMAEALEAVDRAVKGEERRPDAVLLDYHLNHNNARWDHMTGAVVQQAIHDRLGPLPIIGFSGRPMETHDMDGLYTDLTKDGVWDLPDVVAGLPEQQAQTVDLTARMAGHEAISQTVEH
jgi:CheY-like chemotaxis protein